MSKILDRIYKHKAHDKRYSPFLDVTLRGWWLATDLAVQPICLIFKAQVFKAFPDEAVRHRMGAEFSNTLWRTPANSPPCIKIRIA
jgi:hypothetical protein